MQHSTLHVQNGDLTAIAENAEDGGTLLTTTPLRGVGVEERTQRPGENTRVCCHAVSIFGEAPSA